MNVSRIPEERPKGKPGLPITSDLRGRIAASLRASPDQYDRVIARRFGVHPSTVARIRDRLGLEPMSPGRPVPGIRRAGVRRGGWNDDDPTQVTLKDLRDHARRVIDRTPNEEVEVQVTVRLRAKIWTVGASMDAVNLVGGTAKSTCEVIASVVRGAVRAHAAYADDDSLVAWS